MRVRGPLNAAEPLSGELRIRGSVEVGRPGRHGVITATAVHFSLAHVHCLVTLRNPLVALVVHLGQLLDSSDLGERHEIGGVDLLLLAVDKRGHHTGLSLPHVGEMVQLGARELDFAGGLRGARDRLLAPFDERLGHAAHSLPLIVALALELERLHQVLHALLLQLLLGLQEHVHRELKIACAHKLRGYTVREPVDEDFPLLVATTELV